MTTATNQSNGTTQNILSVIALVLLPFYVFSDTSSWLMKINDAASNVNFSGSFVYSHDGKIEAMQVARKIEDGVMQERLYSLNGEPREVIRDMNKVWRFIPDKNIAVHDYRQSSESGFPKILPSDLEALSKNYHFEEGNMERIADREAKQIRVIPNDQYRYGYDLWVDTESGLLLRSDLVNNQNEIIEQYLFVEIQIGGDIPDADLQPVSDTDELQMFGNNTPSTAPADKTHWQLQNMPTGFEMSNHVRRMSPMDANEVEHMVLTDGLSTVSIFIKQANEGQSGMSGLSKMGAVHAFRTTVNNYRVTVMGEVPADTVEFLAMGIALSE